MKLLSSSRARYCRDPGTNDASRHTDKSKDSVWARLDALCAGIEQRRVLSTLHAQRIRAATNDSRGYALANAHEPVLGSPTASLAPMREACTIPLLR